MSDAQDVRHAANLIRDLTTMRPEKYGRFTGTLDRLAERLEKGTGIAALEGFVGKDWCLTIDRGEDGFYCIERWYLSPLNEGGQNARSLTLEEATAALLEKVGAAESIAVASSEERIVVTRQPGDAIAEEPVA